MNVTLAYPFEGHGPDETVDLPDDVARRLLADGAARRPTQPAAKRPARRKKPTPTRPRHDSGTGRVKEN